jgi:signal transduction histidine kinase
MVTHVGARQETRAFGIATVDYVSSLASEAPSREVNHMLEFFRKLFVPDFMPHGYCMRWSSDIIWLHVSADALIALAYYVIPFALIYFVRKRRDLAFDWMFVLFGIFILACGTTHVLGIITLWNPVYRLDGVVKAITALASIATAFLLVRLIPTAIMLPSAGDLRREIDRRVVAEHELRDLNAQLEHRVEGRTKQLKRYNNALQRVAYISSHDLKEPLRSVTTFTQVLEQMCLGRLDVKEAELMKFVVQGSQRMQRMIDDLLEYTRSVNAVNENARMSLTALVAEALAGAIENIRASIEESGARITWDDPLPAVVADPLQLQQVFQNLLTNAIKYRKNSPEIQVSARQEGGQQVITVRDNGIGLEMQYAQQIFEAFTRLNPTETVGSGIGLAICKNIVEAHDGAIWVESDGLGMGAAFHFTLPSAS